MKVSELIEQLENMDQDLPVYASYYYGDSCGSIVAEPICDVEELELTYSAYHRMMKVPEDDEEHYEDEKEPVTAIVLS
jgi:hypothetical protein